MSEPDFYQVTAEIAGCPDPGWKHKVSDDGATILFTHTMWPLEDSTHVRVRSIGPWQDIELVRGEVTSDTDTCKATVVTFEVPFAHRVMLRTFMPDGSVGSTQWFRHIH